MTQPTTPDNLYPPIQPNLDLRSIRFLRHLADLSGVHPDELAALLLVRAIETELQILSEIGYTPEAEPQGPGLPGFKLPDPTPNSPPPVTPPTPPTPEDRLIGDSSGRITGTVGFS